MALRLPRKPRCLSFLLLLLVFLGSFQVPLASNIDAAESTQVDIIDDEGTTQPATIPSAPENSRRRMTLNNVLINAGKRGLGGGVPGAIAGVVQVFTLMWVRTIINYQYRYGTTFARKWNALEERKIPLAGTLQCTSHTKGLLSLYRRFSGSIQRRWHWSILPGFGLCSHTSTSFEVC
jgi:hypothetical protein